MALLILVIPLGLLVWWFQPPIPHEMIDECAAHFGAESQVL